MKTLLTRTLAFGSAVDRRAAAASKDWSRVLPVIEGTYAADPRDSWPVHTMIPDSQYTYSTGWNLQNVHRGHINNYGYASPHDYRPGPCAMIAVFGDSYVESLMNDYRDTLPGALNEFLDLDREVLSFGMAGAEMPDYLGTAPLVRAEFSPRLGGVRDHGRRLHARLQCRAGILRMGCGAVAADPAGAGDPSIRSSASVSRTVGLVRYLRGNLSLRGRES